MGQSWESLEDLNTSRPEAVGFLVPGCHSGSLLERSSLPSNLLSALKYEYLGKDKVIAAVTTGSSMVGKKAIHPWWQPRLLYDRKEKSTSPASPPSPPPPPLWFGTHKTVVPQCPPLSFRPSAEGFILFFLSLWVSHLELPCR